MFKLLPRAAAACLLLIAAVAAALFVLASILRPDPPRVSSAPASGNESFPVSARRIAGPYRAEAIRVVDGDTFEARLRIWFNQDVTVLVRLAGVDAPELRGRCAQESRLAIEARDALVAILASGDVMVGDLHADKYNGRAVARARVTDASGGQGDDVGALLVAGGYARAYDGRARSSWCGPSGARLAEAGRAR